VGDVVNIGTGQVVQPETSVTDIEDPGLILTDDQVRDFIQDVALLDVADTREWQSEVMASIRLAVKAWPDG
jgi:hypothetical protein